MNKHSLPDITIREIEHFVDRVEKDLLEPASIHYFEIDPKFPHEQQLQGINAEYLNQIVSLSGVYAIWTKNNDVVSPRYIGHTAGKTARTRLTNHFFKKNPRTGSQLDRVKQAVANGYVVGYTFVALHPPLIRLYVESELIARHHELCVWNIHSKGVKRKSTIDNRT